VKPQSFFVRVLQALLISAILVAPALGRVHQILHAHDCHQDVQTVLFSDHEEGSLSCVALDHLGSGEAPVGHQVSFAPSQHVFSYQWVLFEKSIQTPAHCFSARAPPYFL
jgi:hypothetical protein